MNRVFTITLALLTSGLLIPFSLPVAAAVSDKEFASLKADLMALAMRVNALEKENAALLDKNSNALATRQSISSSVGSPDSSPTNNITWKGDFRYRYDGIRVEDQDNRERNRIRSRIAMIAQLPKNIELGIGLATGGDDPVSTNQNLGSGGSTKSIGLDYAYFNWSVTGSLNLIAGKYKNIWVRPGENQLIWDSDYNPEGFAVTYDNGHLFVNAGLDWLESDTGKEDSRFSWGLQSGLKTNIGDSTLTTGVSYYALPVEGRNVFYPIGFIDGFAGNSFTCALVSIFRPISTVCTYDNDYEEVEVFAEFKTQVGTTPLTLFADLVRNRAADQFDSAWAAGVKLGRASDSGTWEVSYVYQDVEADSLIGATANADFAGGGTDSKGHILKGTYALNKNWKLEITYFANKRNANLGIEEDYDRIQIDSQFKF